VAGDEIGLAHQVGRADRPGAETEVGGGDGARFLRVVDEVGLDIVVGLFADDGNGVLVGPYCAVGSQTVEQGRIDRAGFIGKGRIEVETGPADVVVYADYEMILGRVILQVVEYRLDHGRGEFLGTEAIASTDDAWRGGHNGGAGRQGLIHCADYVQVQRLAQGSGLLGPVHYGDLPHPGRQHGYECLVGKGPIEPDLDDPNLLAPGGQGFHGLMDRIGA